MQKSKTIMLENTKNKTNIVAKEKHNNIDNIKTNDIIIKKPNEN